MPGFEWGAVENQLFALYMGALRNIAPAAEGDSEPGLFAALARRLGWVPRRDSALAIIELCQPPQSPTRNFALAHLRANTVEKADFERRVRVGRLPWAFAEIALDRARADALTNLIAQEANRASVDHWSRVEGRYLRCLRAVAERIQREAPLVLDVAPDVVIAVDARPWFPRRPGDAPSRFAVPPPPSPELRSKWSHVRAELTAPGVASALLDAAAREAELGDGTPAIMKAVRLVLRAQPRIDDAAIDSALEVIDRGLDVLLNAILHDEALARLEARWRAIAHLVGQIDFRENIRLELLSAGKDVVAVDLRRGSPLERTAFYRHVYASGVRAADGRASPISILVGLWEFGPEEEEIDLLERIATIAMRAHAIVLVEPAPSMFGDTRGILGRGVANAFVGARTLFEEPSHSRWSAFRDADASRQVGVCAVRFRVRRPYELTSPFSFREHVDGTALGPPWASSAFLLVARMAEAFAKYRLVTNFIGTGDAGGLIRDVPGRAPAGDEGEGRWAEERVDSRLDYQLFEQGFISWFEKDGRPHFADATSCHRPRIFENTPEGKREETDDGLARRLPYSLLALRFAQYLEIVRLTTLRALHDRAELEVALQAWLNRVCEPDRAGPLLERAHLTLAQHDADHLAFALELHPRFKYMGASFTLRVNGLIDR